MYSYASQLTYSTDAGRVWKQMAEIKHLYLPQVVMADDFESAWSAYITAYESCSPQIFFDDLQKELDHRIAE